MPAIENQDCLLCGGTGVITTQPVEPALPLVVFCSCIYMNGRMKMEMISQIVEPKKAKERLSENPERFARVPHVKGTAPVIAGEDESRAWAHL